MKMSSTFLKELLNLFSLLELILHPNPQNCTGKYLLPFFGEWERRYSSIPGVLSPSHVSNHLGSFPNFIFLDAIPRDTNSAECNTADSEAGQTAGLELSISGSTMNTKYSRRGTGIRRALEQSKCKPMFGRGGRAGGGQSPGFEFWLCNLLCDLT